jgi:hypothetical protein
MCHERLKSIAKRIKNRAGKVAKCTLFDLAYRSGLVAPKGRKYMRAAHDVTLWGYNWEKDSELTIFVKNENKEVNAFEVDSCKEDADPRVISFRSPKHAVMVAQYLSPCEHKLLQLCGETICKRGGPRGRLFGKGLNQIERAEWIKRKRDRFNRPLVLSIDASRFDRQVHMKMLVLEHLIYVGMLIDDTRIGTAKAEFKRLLDRQIHNFGSTQTGGANIKYSVEGTRASGDMNTGIGNCIQMLIICIGLFESLGVDWDTLIDGDDTLIFIDLSDFSEDLIARLRDHFYDCGHNIKIEKIAYELIDVEWCQHRPLYIDGALRMCRDPRVIIGKSLSSQKFGHDDQLAAQQLHTVALSELIMGQGCPLVQHWAIGVINDCKQQGYKPVDLVHTNDNSLFMRVALELRSMGFFSESQRVIGYYGNNRKYFTADAAHKILKSLLQRFSLKQVSDETRRQYEIAFGFSVSSQLDLEEKFYNAHYDFNAVEQRAFDHSTFNYNII